MEHRNTNKHGRHNSGEAGVDQETLVLFQMEKRFIIKIDNDAIKECKGVLFDGELNFIFLCFLIYQRK